MPPTNVLLTCAGMRGDMVMAFQAALGREGAGGVVVAADMSRLAPTVYLADRSAELRGEMAEAPLGSQLVIPAAALASLYQFHYQSLTPALEHLLGNLKTSD